MTYENARIPLLRRAFWTFRSGALTCFLAAGTAAAALADGAVPARIVSLTPSVTEILYALGAGDRLVGVSDESTEPPACRNVPRVGTFLAPVVERVLSLEPDLVITSPSPGNQNAVLAIERSGVRTAVVTEGSASLADLRSAIGRTAEAIGRSSEGDALLAVIDSALARVRARVAGLPTPRTAVVIGLEPLVLAGSESYLGDLVRLAGGTNVADAVPGRWPRVGWEFLVSAAPEVVIDLSRVGAPDAEGGRGAGSSRASFEDLPAGRNGRVYRPTGDLLLRPGPRVAQAAAEIAGALHPEAWQENHP